MGRCGSPGPSWERACVGETEAPAALAREPALKPLRIDWFPRERRQAVIQPAVPEEELNCSEKCREDGQVLWAECNS